MSVDFNPKPLSKASANALAAKVNAMKLANEKRLDYINSLRGSGTVPTNNNTEGKIEIADGKMMQIKSMENTKNEVNLKNVQDNEIVSNISCNIVSGDKEDKSSDDRNTKTEKISVAEKALLQKVVRKGLINNKYDLEIKRKDPSSPLYSIKSFENLRIKAELLKGIYEMNFNAPSKIQETAVPTLLADPPSNMIAQSQSGTGKTAAFSLAVLSRVNPALDYPQALCLSPTYELAIQTGEVIARMGKYIKNLKIRYAVRGEEAAKGEKFDYHIVIGTPGKVNEWTLRRKIFELSKLKVFVLDEADVMIDTQGHLEESIRIRKQLSDSCQLMLFSATYEPKVMKFAEAVVPNAIVIKLKREEESLENIKQYYVRCYNMDEKYKAIENIYAVATVGQAMIFCQTKRTAEYLSERLTSDGHAVALLTGSLTVDQRINVLDRFRDGKHKILITTNVLARGIDIENVTIVVNFDLPVDMSGRADCETYLHRIGRTGRFGKAGIAINIVDSDRGLIILKEIEEHFGILIKLINMDDVDDIEQINNE